MNYLSHLLILKFLIPEREFIQSTLKKSKSKQNSKYKMFSKYVIHGQCMINDGGGGYYVQERLLIILQTQISSLLNVNDKFLKEILIPLFLCHIFTFRHLYITYIHIHILTFTCRVIFIKV